MLDRKEGYYWVKTQDGDWHIARWNQKFGELYWKVCFSRFSMYDQDFLEIDENRIIHKEEKISE